MAKHFFEGQILEKPDGFYYTLTTSTAGSWWTSPEVKLEAQDSASARSEAMGRCEAFLRALKG